MKKNYLKKISFGLLVAILVVLAFGTIVEKLFGQDFVFTNVYHAWWFVGLWAALAISSLVYILQRRGYKQKAVFLLHCALLVILAGAFVTFIWGERGYIHLRQGKPLNAFTLEDGITKQPLPFDIKLVLFEINYHPNSDQPADFISFL